MFSNVGGQENFPQEDDTEDIQGEILDQRMEEKVVKNAQKNDN
jgi:hypothetical protein